MLRTFSVLEGHFTTAMQGSNSKGWLYLFKARKCSNVHKVSSKLPVLELSIITYI
jgi:hypothetical protein